MKRKIVGAVLAAVLAVGALSPMTALADSQKVVTLGADLSDEQRAAVLKYFGIQGQNVQTLTITNQDERNHLGSYIPLEQIGTRTFSCALVNPTTSGGIQVKTANLNYVTGNMIASTLSTSGVTNCQVLAASPFEVSGTGALTGVIMAYETASGTTLDTTKKEIATEELVTTLTIADTVGQDTATNIVNEIKIQVIEGQTADPSAVNDIVDDVVEQNGSSLTVEDRQLLEDLANKIAQQQYDYDQMKETLERVEQNTSGGVNVNVNVNNTNENNQVNNNDQTNEQSVNVSNDSSSNSNAEAKDSSEENIFIDAGDTTALGTDVITTNSVDSSNLNEAELEAQQAQAADTQADVDASVSADDGFNWTEETFTFGDENQGTDAFTEDAAPGEGAADAPAEAAAEDTTWNEQVWTDDFGAGEVNDAPAEAGEENVAQLPEEAPAEAVDDASAQPAEEDAAPVTLTAEDVKVIPSEQADAASGVAGTAVVRVAAANIAAANAAGNLAVLDASGNQLVSVDLADGTKTAIRDLEDADAFGLTAVSEGSELVVLTGNVFADPGFYTINVENLVLTDEAGQQILADGNYSYDVFVDDTAGLTIGLSQITDLTAGNTVSAAVLLDGINYTYAVVSTDGASYTDAQEITLEDTAFALTLSEAGTTVITVDFYSEDGSYVSTYDFEIPVLE